MSQTSCQTAGRKLSAVHERRAYLRRGMFLILAGFVWGRGRAQTSAFSQDLEGVWLVAVENDSRDRFLQLFGVRFKDGRISATTAKYGWIDGKAQPITELDGRVDGTRIHLRFTTPAHSRIEVEIDAGNQEQAFMGTMVTQSDRRRQVRLTRLSAQDFDQMRSAASLERMLSKGQVSRDSVVQLLYVGAPDCPACSGWEAEYFGRKQMMAERLPEFDRIVFTKAKLASYRGGHGLALVLPESLQALARPGPRGQSPILRCRGTPYFALLVDQRLVIQVHGTSAFEKTLVPLVRQAVELKERAS